MRILEAPGKSAIATIAALAGTAFSGYAVPGITAIAPVRRALFRRLSGASCSSALALTFDDGPDPKSTPMFLDRLEGLGWKATFFMLGSMAEREPALTREVQARGHEIALHGYLHKNLLWRTPRATDSDIRKGFDTMAQITGTTPRFYRPPYGVLNTQALLTTRSLKLTPVLWTTWGRDWRAKATPESVFYDLANGIQAGATLLLHDSDCTSAKESYLSALGALDPLSERVTRLGLSVERLCDHFPD